MDFNSNIESIIDSLLDSDIIFENDSIQLEVTEKYCESYSETQQKIHSYSNSELQELVRKASENESEASELINISTANHELLAEYLTLTKVGSLNHGEIIQILTIWDSFHQQQVRSEGCPNGFLPVRVYRIPLIVTVIDSVIAYIWRDDCPPCKQIKETLDTLKSTNETALIGCYGPDNPNLLFDRYEVRGGPTILFFLDGSIDARLVGEQNPKIIEREFEKHLTLSV